MTAPTRFDLSAAYSAQSRSDDGIALLPGDVELIAALEGWCQQGSDRFEYAAWLAEQCTACGPAGSSGSPCDECRFEPEADAARTPVSSHAERRALHRATQRVVCPTCSGPVGSLLAGCPKPGCVTADVAEDHHINRLNDL